MKGVRVIFLKCLLTMTSKCVLCRTLSDGLTFISHIHHSTIVCFLYEER